MKNKLDFYPAVLGMTKDVTLKCEEISLIHNALAAAYRREKEIAGNPKLDTTFTRSEVPVERIVAFHEKNAARYYDLWTKIDRESNELNERMDRKAAMMADEANKKERAERRAAKAAMKEVA